MVPLNIHFGAEVYRDGVDMGKQEFYERLVQSAVLPRTSQPTVSDFQATYDALAGDPATEAIRLRAPGRQALGHDQRRADGGAAAVRA